MAWYCDPCDRYFVSRHSLQQHYDNSVLHYDNYICSYCDDEFHSQYALNNHVDSVHEYPYHCQECSTMFRTQYGLDEHVEEEHPEPEWWCHDCDRQFMNENNLRMHLNSRIHRGTNITCPWCKNTYATATGLTTHLESGSCRDGINRETIYNTIRRHDQGGAFTHKMIEGPNGQRFNQTVTATERSWNGRFYECPLCTRECRTLPALNQHLNSPAHQQNLYHCPKCNKQAKTLAALINHIESGSCGIMTFDRVQKNIQGIVTGKRMIQF